MNYAPFDITYKFYQLLPIKALIACLKEIHRANKVYRGVMYAIRAYPQSYVIIFTVGALKGKHFSNKYTCSRSTSHVIGTVLKVSMS